MSVLIIQIAQVVSSESPALGEKTAQPKKAIQSGGRSRNTSAAGQLETAVRIVDSTADDSRFWMRLQELQALVNRSLQNPAVGI